MINRLRNARLCNVAVRHPSGHSAHAPQKGNQTASPSTMSRNNKRPAPPKGETGRRSPLPTATAGGVQMMFSIPGPPHTHQPFDNLIPTSQSYCMAGM